MTTKVLTRHLQTSQTSSVDARVLPTCAVIVRLTPQFSIQFDKEHANTNITFNDIPTLVGKSAVLPTCCHDLTDGAKTYIRLNKEHANPDMTCTVISISVGKCSGLQLVQ